MWSCVEIQTWGKLAETGNKAVRLNASLGVGIVRGAVPASGTPACNCWAKRQKRKWRPDQAEDEIREIVGTDMKGREIHERGNAQLWK